MTPNNAYLLGQCVQVVLLVLALLLGEQFLRLGFQVLGVRRIVAHERCLGDEIKLGKLINMHLRINIV